MNHLENVDPIWIWLFALVFVTMLFSPFLDYQLWKIRNRFK